VFTDGLRLRAFGGRSHGYRLFDLFHLSLGLGYLPREIGDVPAERIEPLLFAD
jgi:hypothetical protein